jgi:hypothetical protein
LVFGTPSEKLSNFIKTQAKEHALELTAISSSTNPSPDGYFALPKPQEDIQDTRRTKKTNKTEEAKNHPPNQLLLPLNL